MRRRRRRPRPAPGPSTTHGATTNGWRSAAAHNALDAPISIYEVHLGSWRREADDKLPTYRDIAVPLAEYARDLGFTHVELMPITEHPFYGSWGYQTTGYFAPTARYGTPQDFMHLVDVLHQHGIGVILDWVPSHFPSDAHGLAYFDGTHLYEHADPRQGFHPEWNSFIFNYARNEVRAFLLSSALFWLDRYHIDGLRVDGVASMLYLDYGRRAGEWIPNVHGGRENLGAIQFLRELNETVYRDYPDTQVIAEESTSWPMVSRPNYIGGLGFGMKWNMGWMHDTLDYMRQEPIYRKYHHDKMTFSIWYAFFENFVLPLSHDEVVYGKGSLIGKMPGDTWQQFANLRAAVRLHVGASGQEAPLHGRRVRPAPRMDARRRAGMVGAAQRRARGRATLGRRPERALSARAGAARGRFQSRRLRVGRLPRFRGERVLVPAPPAPRTAGSRRLQFHAGSAHQLHGRRTGGRLLARAAEQRCRALRGQRRRQSGRRRGRAGAVARPVPLARADRAAARDRVPEAGAALAGLADAAQKARARAA